MLNVKFFVNSSKQVCGFKISGHANYDEYNRDIVCAAVSSAAYMTSNIITDILKIKANIEVNEGFMCVCVPEEYVLSCKTVLDGFKLHLLQLQKSYSKNIKVTKEVI